ncbi:uncharacterized protein LOC143374918 [Andrena cerasifolii]|uniref:uncharacterized protein LOC143374918 n=1 Tax=Andrena cerasifolii TaxID=2819439 RepID=UPI0040381765
MLLWSKKLRKHRGSKSKLWKLLSIHDFKSFIQPYICAISIVGFFPYEIESSKFIFSEGRSIWSKFVLIVYICTSLFASHQMNFHVEYRNASLLLRTNIITFWSITIVLVTGLTSRSKLRVLQRLFDVSRVLSPQIFRKMGSGMRRKDLTLLVILSFYLIFAFTNDVLMHYTNWFTLFVMLLMYMLYVNSIRVLKACLERIDESLMKFRRTLITDEPHLLRREYHTKMNPLLIRQLKSLRERYLEIGEIVSLLNDSFGFEIIGIVGLTILNVTFNIYDFAYMLLNDDNYSIWWCLGITFMTYFIGNLIYMTCACEATRDQAKRIASSIHQNLVTTFDERLTAELEAFSMQVLQQDCSFCAMGLTIDAGLLTKVMNCIATYLLILIQFLLVKSC